MSITRQEKSAAAIHARPASAYKFRPGDVLQMRSEHLQARPWLPYADITPVKHASAIEAVKTGVYCGVKGEWRIVRDGKQVAP